MGTTGDAPQTDSLLLLHGGGSIPCSIGWVSLSVPLVRLEASTAGLSLSARGALIRKFFGIGASWTVAWDDIDYVLAARHSVLVVPRRGRVCRFVALRASPISALLPVLKDRRVRSVATRTTFFKLFTARPSAN